MATTYDYVDGQSSGNDYFGKYSHCAGTDNHFVWKRRINLATAGDTLTTGAFGAADVLKLFEVKEGIMVRDVVIHVITAEGDTLAVTIGDGDDPDGFLVAGDLDSADTWECGSTQATYAADYLDGTTYYSGKLYTATDTIDMTLTTASADVAVFDIFVIGVDLSQGQYIL